MLEEEAVPEPGREVSGEVVNREFYDSDSSGVVAEVRRERAVEFVGRKVEALQGREVYGVRDLSGEIVGAQIERLESR